MIKIQKKMDIQVNKYKHAFSQMNCIIETSKPGSEEALQCASQPLIKQKEFQGNSYILLENLILAFFHCL